MIVQRKAIEEISSILDLIWYVEEDNLEDARSNDIIVPTGHIHIVYNFKDPYFLNEDNILQIPDVVLVGQMKKAVKIKYGTNVKQFGLAFRPTALFGLFNQLSGLYTGAIVDCSQIQSMKELHKTVKNIIQTYDCVDQIFMAIEAYFEQYKYIVDDVESLEDMIDYIDDHKGLIDVKLMADYFGYSVSSLERNFKKYIGLTPKTYGNILRFRYAMIEEDHQVLFYDQSHFIKNCRRYTHKVPGEISSAEEISLRHMLEFHPD